MQGDGPEEAEFILCPSPASRQNAGLYRAASDHVRSSGFSRFFGWAAVRNEDSGYEG
jgi:hypothetical protein